MQNNQSGFVALISVIIITAVLILLLGLVASTSFFTRFNVLDYENKKVSYSLSEACVQNALIQLAKNNAYLPAVGGEVVTLEPGKSCKICSVSGSNPFTVKTRAVYKDSYFNIQVSATLGANNFTINSWEEQAAYSGPSCAVP